MTLKLAFASIAALALVCSAAAQTAPAPAAFVCPKTQTLNCMPIVPAERRAFCGKDYLDWAAKHCPGLQVVY